jgi:hypothetical protein
MDRSASPESAWQPDHGSAKSAHPMIPAVVRRSSAAVSIGDRSRSLTRRNSSVSVSQRRAPSRTDSGREFWGLPDASRKPRDTFEDLQEDDSEDDEEEWVSPAPYKMSLTSREKVKSH